MAEAESLDKVLVGIKLGKFVAIGRLARNANGLARGLLSANGAILGSSGSIVLFFTTVAAESIAGLYRRFTCSTGLCGQDVVERRFAFVLRYLALAG